MQQNLYKHHSRKIFQPNTIPLLERFSEKLPHSPLCKQLINIIFEVNLGQYPMKKKGRKSLTRRDVEQVRWKQVPTYGMTRETCQGTK